MRPMPLQAGMAEAANMTVKRMPQPAIMVLVFSLLVVCGQAGEEPKDWRIVEGRVLNVDGTPSSGVMVYLVGIERTSTMFLHRAKENADWRWKTDESGRFTARFYKGLAGSFTQDGGPGWGAFHFVVLPGDEHSGGVSCQIVNPKPRPIYQFYKSSNEWGERKVMGDRPLEIVVQLQKGITVKGRIEDLDEGTPIAGAPVSMNHDLHARSHTGYGGEIFKRSTESGPDGRFVFEHVYPAQAHLGIGGPYTWLRTRMGDNGRWIEDRVDEIAVKSTTGTLVLTIGASDDPKRFSIHGVVTDSAGIPLAGAKVSAGVSFHKTLKTYGDSHMFREDKTDANGAYTISLKTPWIRFIRAEKEHFRESLAGMYDGVNVSPGQYDFRLESTKTGTGK